MKTTLHLCLVLLLLSVAPATTVAGPACPSVPVSPDAEGRAAFLAGRLDDAEAAWRRSLSDAQARADPKAEAGAHRELALLERARGRYAAALLELDRALERDRAAADPIAEARDLGLQAETHLDMGDVVEANALQAQALPALEKAGPSKELAAAFRRSGQILSALGDDAKALDLLDRALETSQEIKDEPGVVEALVATGEAEGKAATLAEALATLERAVAVATAAGDHAGIGRALGAIATLYRQSGDTRRALEYQERALTMLQGAGDARDVVSSLVALGLTRLGAGDAAGAREAYEQARKRAEALEARDLLVLGWWGEARARLQGGDQQEAAEAARRAVEALPAVFGALSEEQGAAARAEHGGVFGTGAAAAAALDDPALLYFFLESGRAGTLLEFLGDRDALQAVQPRPELLEAEKAARREEVAALTDYRAVREAGGRGRIRRARKRLDQARETLKDVIERIQREAKDRAGALLPPIASLDEIEKALAKDEALVLYGLLAPEAVALVVESGGARIVRLGAPGKIDAAFHDLDLDDADGDPEPSLAALRALAVDPLRLEPCIRHVLVSPDGVLDYVPLGILLGDRDVAYVPSGTTWRLLEAARQPPGRDVLALGDPVYGRPDEPSVTASVRSGVNLARLPFTRDEALAVGDVVLLGADATEAGFRYAVTRRKRWRAIHFACHGVVDPDEPTLSSLALTPDGENDGFLTALDVFRLRLPADLVVLSACDSGVGKIVNAEGVLGLMRAFLFAGAPRVIVSLGLVDDHATRTLMEAFYRRWREGTPAAEALREAQQEVKSHPQWAHPHYWANWVLWGLPR